MTSLSKRYKIADPTPFFDVDTTDDTPMFVDPRRIRVTTEFPRVRQEAIGCLDTFWDALADAVLTRSSDGPALLKQFHELPETRLGLSKKGVNGSGTGDEIGQHMWDELSGNLHALVRVAILKHVEDLPVFIPNVGNDRTSDITTRIVLGPLVTFTHQMLQQYPQMGGNVKEYERQLWDPVSRGWVMRKVKLPVVNGKPLLLVPRRWVRRTLMMTSSRFYGTSALDYVKDSETRVLGNGKLDAPTKKELRERRDLREVYPTNRRVTQDASDNNIDILHRFRTRVDNFEKLKHLK